MKLEQISQEIKKVWHFLWKEDSVSSWVVNLILAFLVIRFMVYPLLGILLGTSYPIVAVVSESMEHSLYNGVICGQSFEEFQESFDHYWQTCGRWYEEKGISKEEFKQFPFQNGFNKGDVIVLRKADSTNLKIGDILVFQSVKPQPIIHRVVAVTKEQGSSFYQTKGDHNSESISGLGGETKISEDRILGKGLIRIPYLGWVKLIFVEMLKPLGINIEK